MTTKTWGSNVRRRPRRLSCLVVGCGLVDGSGVVAVVVVGCANGSGNGGKTGSVEAALWPPAAKKRTKNGVDL